MADVASLKDRILAGIAAEGPIPFEAFMAACLYDVAAGFFTSGTLRSTKSGDFLTSPEVSPRFGEMIARFVQQEWARVGRPDRFAAIDAGAGSGSLLRALLGSWREHPPEAWAVEVSPAAQAVLAAVVGASQVVTSLAEIPGPVDGVVVANELVDNLPMALAISTGTGWEELWVGADGDELTYVNVPVRPEVSAWLAAFGGNVAVGGVVEVQLEAAAWLTSALRLIGRGAVVVIDYGGTVEELSPRRARGTMRTYRAHHLGPDPLREPGATDVTADVNFTALLATVAAEGFVGELLRQDDFLGDLGLRMLSASLRRSELESAREGNATERLAIRSDRADVEALLHPRGLGDFRVLVARDRKAGGRAGGHPAARARDKLHVADGPSRSSGA